MSYYTTNTELGLLSLSFFVACLGLFFIYTTFWHFRHFCIFYACFVIYFTLLFSNSVSMAASVLLNSLSVRH